MSDQNDATFFPIPEMLFMSKDDKTLKSCTKSVMQGVLDDKLFPVKKSDQISLMSEWNAETIKTLLAIKDSPLGKDNEFPDLIHEALTNLGHLCRVGPKNGRYAKAKLDISLKLDPDFSNDMGGFSIINSNCESDLTTYFFESDTRIMYDAVVASASINYDRYEKGDLVNRVELIAHCDPRLFRKSLPFPNFKQPGYPYDLDPCDEMNTSCPVRNRIWYTINIYRVVINGLCPMLIGNFETNSYGLLELGGAFREFLHFLIDSTGFANCFAS